jgi:hypothetical protein
VLDEFLPEVGAYFVMGRGYLSVRFPAVEIHNDFTNTPLSGSTISLADDWLGILIEEPLETTEIHMNWNCTAHFRREENSLPNSNFAPETTRGRSIVATRAKPWLTELGRQR